MRIKYHKVTSKTQVHGIHLSFSFVSFVSFVYKGFQLDLHNAVSTTLLNSYRMQINKLGVEEVYIVETATIFNNQTNMTVLF